MCIRDRYKEVNAGKESRQIARLKDVLRYVAKNDLEPIALKEAADIALSLIHI